MGDTEKKLGATQIQSFDESRFEDLEKTRKLNENNHFSNLFKLREKDSEWKIKRRPYFGWTLIALFLFQNVVVFSLIIVAYIFGNLKSLEVILGIIVTGTLAETAFGVNVIIKWLFSDIDYQKK